VPLPSPDLLKGDASTLSRKSTRRRDASEIDLIAELLQLSDQATRLSSGVKWGQEVMCTEISVLDSVVDHVPGRDEQAVTDGDQRTFLAAPSGEPVVLGLAVAVLRPRSGSRGFS
jgi:hypothetical protein